MLNHVLSQVNTVAIGGHVRPDGDCVGSCMGLYQYIKKCYPYIKVDVYLEEIPDSFVMFDVVKDIKHEVAEGAIYDLFIALDCADKSRLGFSEHLFDTANYTVCVDHHISNMGFAQENYIVAEASSTAELVFRLMHKEEIDTDIAECLYLGIVHDTGVFQYSCTSPETMEAAAYLMRKNIRANEIIDKTYYEKTYAQNRVLGHALLNSKLTLNNQCIVSYVTKDMMDEFQVKQKDLEGIVSQLRVTQGVEVAIFFYEIGLDEYKVSLRASGDVDVSKVAQVFGGGGHVKAAGLTMKGKVQDIIDALVEQIGKQL